MHKVIYKHQSLEMVSLPRSEGSMGLTAINHSHRATIVAKSGTVP